MKRKLFLIFHPVIFVFLLMGSFQSHADVFKIYGTISDTETGAAIPEATVLFILGNADTTKTATDVNGNYETYIEVMTTSADNFSQPESFHLSQNYPNPFNPTTVIEYQIPKADKVQLAIFNIMGQKICQLVDGYQNEGLHKVTWNGRDDNGKNVAAGVFLYQLKMGAKSVVRKMLLIDGGGKGNLNPNLSLSRTVKNVRKIAVGPSFTLVVKKESFLAFEDYGFTIPPDGHVDFTLQHKKDATLYGTIQYQPCVKCRTTNWNGIIDPINIILYDTNDYSKKLSDITIEYPDTTFEITGLPEGILDMVIQGDDIISIKHSEIQTFLGENLADVSKVSILYNQDATINMYITSNAFDMRLKENFDDPQTAEKILEEYGCTLEQYNTYGDITFYIGIIPNYDFINSAQIVRMLNNDQRVKFAEVGAVIFTAKKIDGRE